MSSVFDDDTDNGDKAPKAVKVEPPSGDAPKKRGRPKGTLNQASVKKIEDGLNEMLMMPALALQAAGDGQCAWVLVGDGSPGRQMTAAWANLAKQSAPVRKALTGMIQGGAIGGVVVSTATVFLLIGAHHGVWPERINQGAELLMAQIMEANSGEE